MHEESLFRSTVAQLGLEVEVYGQEVGSSYEEHFVIEGDSLTVDEQDGNAFDEPIADLTLDEIDEIAKTYGMKARISARKAKRSFSLSENTKTRLRCPRMSVLPASIPIARFT